MAFTPIVNEEGGQSVRDKLNTMLQTLFEIGDFWEEVAEKLQPIGEMDVAIGNLDVTNLLANSLEVDSELTLDYLSLHHVGIKQIGVDPNGKVVTYEEASAPGDAMFGKGAKTVQENHDIQPTHPTILTFATSDHIDLYLPLAMDSVNGEVVVRHCYDTGGYATTIRTTGSVDFIQYNDDYNAPGGELVTTEKGAWIRLKAVTDVGWFVIEHGGSWTLNT